MTKFSFEVKLKAGRMYLAGIGSSTIWQIKIVFIACPNQVIFEKTHRWNVDGMTLN